MSVLLKVLGRGPSACSEKPQSSPRRSPKTKGLYRWDLELFQVLILHRSFLGNVPLRITDVDLTWPSNFLFRIQNQFLPLRQPAGHAGNRKEDRKDVHREDHGLIDQSGVKVDVWIQFSLDEIIIGESYFLELKSNVQQLVSSGFLENIFRNFLDYCRSWIVVFVDPVAKAHEQSLALLYLSNDFRHLVLRSD